MEPIHPSHSTKDTILLVSLPDELFSFAVQIRLFCNLNISALTLTSLMIRNRPHLLTILILMISFYCVICYTLSLLLTHSDGTCPFIARFWPFWSINDLILTSQWSHSDLNLVSVMTEFQPLFFGSFWPLHPTLLIQSLRNTTQTIRTKGKFFVDASTSKFNSICVLACIHPFLFWSYFSFFWQ